MILSQTSAVRALGPVGVGGNFGEVTALNDGRFMVVWTQLVNELFPIPGVEDDGFLAVLGRVFNADGTPSGAVFQASATSAFGETNADIATLSNGNVVVSYQYGPDTSGSVEAYARILTADGVPVTGQIQLSDTTERDQRIPHVLADADGGFTATWQDDRPGYDERWMLRSFDAAGNPTGPVVIAQADQTSEDGDLLQLDNGLRVIVNEQQLYAWSEADGLGNTTPRCRSCRVARSRRGIRDSIYILAETGSNWSDSTRLTPSALASDEELAQKSIQTYLFRPG